MKKLVLTLSLCLFWFMAKSQTASVEKQTVSIQTGVLGIYVNHESRLADRFALRLEGGLDSGIWGGSFYPKTGFLMAPVLTVEPRYYYNITRRADKGKRIDGNSGNFLTLKTSYHPDWFVISNYDQIQVVSDISFVPTWGIKRNIGQHFNYEAGFGLGIRYTFAKKAGFLENETDGAANIHLRIGYRF